MDSSRWKIESFLLIDALSYHYLPLRSHGHRGAAGVDQTGAHSLSSLNFSSLRPCDEKPLTAKGSCEDREFVECAAGEEEC